MGEEGEEGEEEEEDRGSKGGKGAASESLSVRVLSAVTRLMLCGAVPVVSKKSSTPPSCCQLQNPFE